MNPTRYARASQLFLEAVGLPQDERRAFLEQECGDDAELFEEVESLIAQDERAAAVDTPVLDRSAAESVMDVGATATRFPQQIDRFEILEEIGRGGMGVVYRARQTNPSRDVALKIVSPFMNSDAMSRRVEFEAQVLARLQHPGIAQIFEAGSTDIGGRTTSYFAMELIEGKPLDVYARDESLNTERRLRLFLRICDAVQHAHQKGIIHRDLKPANILVNKDGQPKILDFGIARMTDADIRTTTLKTSVGQLIGTVAYMSPEQVSGDPNAIDTRSDVYALGVVGFELLTGRMPYSLEKKTVADAAVIIRDTDPTSLGTIDRTYRGDVETIFGKALEKDKERRYESVAELANDVGRFLRSEPISARPPSVMYQIGKFTRRHRALVAGVSAAFVLLILAVVGTSYGLFEARRERDAAIEARENLSKAKTAVEEEKDKFLAISRFLRRMLESANPLSEVGYAAKDITVLEMLDRESDRVDEWFENEPAMAAALHTTFGSVYAGLARREDAENHFRRAVKFHRQIAPIHTDTARAMRDLGAILARSGKWDEAKDWFEQSLEMNRSLEGEYGYETAMCEARFGYALLNHGEVERAEGMMRNALARLEASDAPEHRDLVAGSKNNLAKILSGKKQYDEAQRLYGEALEIYRKNNGMRHATVGMALNNYARILHQKGDLKAARDSYQEAIEIVRDTVGEHHPFMATVANNLAFVLFDLGETEESLKRYSEALAASEATYGRDSHDFISTLNNLAYSQQDLERWDDAIKSFEEITAYRRKHLGVDDYRTLVAQMNWGMCLTELGRLDEATPLLLGAFEGLKAGRTLKDQYTQRSVDALIKLYEALGNESDAERYRQLKSN